MSYRRRVGWSREGVGVGQLLHLESQIGGVVNRISVYMCLEHRYIKSL